MYLNRDAGQIKTPFVLKTVKGRRAITIALVVPPRFVDASRHQPCRVLTYSSPVTGATGRVLLSRYAISSRSFRLLFTASYRMGFSPAAHSLNVTPSVTRPIIAFAVFSCSVLNNV